MLHLYLEPLSLDHWTNDELMVPFFLLVGVKHRADRLGR
jgi:Na+/H+ antiporter NhaA